MIGIFGLLKERVIVDVESHDLFVARDHVEAPGIDRPGIMITCSSTKEVRVVPSLDFFGGGSWYRIFDDMPAACAWIEKDKAGADEESGE